MTADVANALTEVERSELAEAEAVIEHGLQTFVEVGEALAKVRDARLYRAEFGTFEDYCRNRWGLTGARVYQLIDASKVVSTIVETTQAAPLPANEGQARELSGLEPERAAEVMRTTHEATGGNVTAAAIRRVRAETHQARAVEAVRRYPDLAHYYDVARTPADFEDVWRMGDKLDEFAERGELEKRLDNLRRSIAVDRAKRDGVDLTGMTATPTGQGDYVMAPMAATPEAASITCPTCGQPTRRSNVA